MPAMPEPEIYTTERKAEFLLNNALRAEEYRWAVEEVCRLGINPTGLEHSFRNEPWHDINAMSLGVSV